MVLLIQVPLGLVWTGLVHAFVDLGVKLLRPNFLQQHQLVSEAFLLVAQPAVLHQVHLQLGCHGRTEAVVSQLRLRRSVSSPPQTDADQIRQILRV